MEKITAKPRKVDVEEAITRDLFIIILNTIGFLLVIPFLYLIIAPLYGYSVAAFFIGLTLIIASLFFAYNRDRCGKILCRRKSE